MSDALMKLAGKAYPRRRVCQLHFMEGFKAEAGDTAAARGLVGSKAERAGAAAAREYHPHVAKVMAA